MYRETVVDKLELPSNVFCTGKYGKYNINISQQSTDTVQSFKSDLPLSALEKTVMATVSCLSSDPDFLSSCSDKSVIATSASNLNSAKLIIDANLIKHVSHYDVLVQYLHVTSMMLQLIGQRHHSLLT